MNQLEKYRENLAGKMTAIWTWLQEIVLFIIAPSNRITWRDVWNQLLIRLCVVKSRIAVDSKEKKRLLDWVATKIQQGKPPTDFNESWKNGIALCALVEGVVKGSCPRYDLLNPKHAASNLKLALNLIEKNVRIKPGITVEDFSHYDSATERKLICLVSQLKLASAKLRLKSVIQRPVISLNPVTTITAEGECIAKGMGLMLAVKGRKARFHIYLKPLTTMNIVVEIRGPENTICSERITSRSPKRRSPAKLKEEEEWRKIPLEYDIQPGKITVGYTPLVIGSHRLSIIWQGQHIIGSPYTISVDDAARTVAAEPKEIKRLIVPLKRADSLEDFAKKGNISCKKLNSVAFGDVRKLGNVTKKRILRHYLIVDGKEVVIENCDLDTLGKAVNDIRVKNKTNSDNCDASQLNNDLAVDHDKSNGNRLTHSDEEMRNVSSNSHLEAIVQTVGRLESDNNQTSISRIQVDEVSISSVQNMTTNYENLEQSDHCATSSKYNNLCCEPTKLHSNQEEENNKISEKPQILLSSDNLQSNSLLLCDTSPLSEDDIKEGSADNSSDVSQRIIVSASKTTLMQEGECCKSNNVGSVHFPCDHANSGVSSPASIMQIRSSPEETIENAFESSVVNANNATVTSTNFGTYKKSYNIPLHDTEIQYLEVLNPNIAKTENDKLEKSNGGSERSSRSHCKMSQVLIHLDDNNTQQNDQEGTTVQGTSRETSNIKEKINSENFDQICFQRTDVSKSQLIANDNDVLEHSKQDKQHTKHNMDNFKENGTSLQQFTDSINELEFSRQEIEAAIKYDNKNNLTEENLLERSCINEIGEKMRTVENYDQEFQSASDNGKMFSTSTNKQKIGSEEESQSEEKNEEISSKKEQERYSIEEVVCRTHHGNDVQKYTHENFKRTKQHNDLIDHRREGFLLGLVDENFKVVESADIEECKSSKVHYNRDVSNYGAVMLKDSYPVRKLSDNAVSDMIMDVGKFMPSSCQRDCSTSIDLTAISKGALLADKEIQTSFDTFIHGQQNWNLLHSDKETATETVRHSQEVSLFPEQNLCSVRFDEGNSFATESGFANHNGSSQNIVESSNLLVTTNQNEGQANKPFEKVICNIDVPSGSCKKNNLEIRYPFEEQDNNSDNENMQMEVLTNLQSSKLSEDVKNQHQTTKEELNILKGSEGFKSLQVKGCDNFQRPQYWPNSRNFSNTMESPSSCIQHSNIGTKQCKSESETCFSYDEEEDFPFSAIVQAKKEYWEKKLEEKEPKQIQKVSSVKKDSNNVEKLKSFWQHVAKDSEKSERTKIHTYRSTSS